jgi:hypothetical protein
LSPPLYLRVFQINGEVRLSVDKQFGQTRHYGPSWVDHRKAKQLVLMN